jgi:hypothetical protein
MGHRNIARLLTQSGADIMLDPGASGTITVRQTMKVSAIVTAAVETRTLSAPDFVGMFHTMYMQTDLGTCTITVTNGYDQAGNTSLVFSDVGDYALLTSINDNGTLRWQVVQYVSGSEAVSTENIQLDDNDSIQFGTGSDVTVDWDGTRLVSSAAANAMWDDCPSKLDPNYLGQVFEFEDDFTDTIDGTATVGRWAFTTVGSGTTVVADDVAGGILLMTPQATTDDAAEAVTGANASFLLAANKTLWYETRLKIVGDIQSEHSFGLCAKGEDLTAVADVLPADGVSFSTQDATLAAALTLSKSGTDTGAVAGVHTLVTNTYVTLGFKIVGLTSVTPYVNGVAGTAATATFNDDEAMTPYFLTRNGDGTTQQIMHVDYVKVIQLR